MARTAYRTRVRRVELGATPYRVVARNRANGPGHLTGTYLGGPDE